MVKVLIFLFVGIMLSSCKKDKTIPLCTGVEMTGDKSKLVGKWTWYQTTVEQWFDVGPSIYHIYTPSNQNLEYYFTISENGNFKGYRNDTLRDDFLLSNVEFEDLQASMTNSIRFSTDCSTISIRFLQDATNVTNDSIVCIQYPYYFNDEANHLRSKLNYFAKE